MARDRQQSVVEKSHSESKHQERDLCNSRVCNLVLLALPRHDEPCSRAPQLAPHKTSRSRRLPAAAQLGGRAVPPLCPVVLLRCRDLSCGFPWERLVQANIALLPGSTCPAARRLWGNCRSKFPPFFLHLGKGSHLEDFNLGADRFSSPSMDNPEIRLNVTASREEFWLGN